MTNEEALKKSLAAVHAALDEFEGVDNFGYAIVGRIAARLRAAFGESVPATDID